MVKHYWQEVRKGVALCRSEKKALETEQRKTSVASGAAASGVTTDDAGEGGGSPEGWTNATLDNKSISRLEMGPCEGSGTNRTSCKMAVRGECENTRRPARTKS